jgi:hypothetical protein
MPRIPRRWKFHLAFPLAALILPILFPASILHGQQLQLPPTTSPDPGIPPSPGQLNLPGDASQLDHPHRFDKSCPIAHSGIDLSFPMTESISEVDPIERSQLLSGLNASPTCPLEVQQIPESITVAGQTEAMATTGEVPEGKLTNASMPQQEGSSDSNQAFRGSEKDAGDAELSSEPPFRLKEEYRSYDAPTPTQEGSPLPMPQEQSATPDIAEANDAPRYVVPPDDGAAPAPSEPMEKPIAPSSPIAPTSEIPTAPQISSHATITPSMETATQKIASLTETLPSERDLVACAEPDQGTPPSPIRRPVLRNRPASTILQKMRRLWERCTSGNLQTEGQIPNLDQLPSIQNIHRLPMRWHYQLPASKIASLPWVEYPLTDRWHLTLPTSLPGSRPFQSFNDPQSLVHDADPLQQPSSNHFWNQTAKEFGRWLGTQVRRPRHWERTETAQWIFQLWR